jgi:hypothetical protein
MDDALQRKVDRIARRQWYVLVLLVYPYLAAGVWFATDNRFLAGGVPVLVIAVAAYLAALVRARTDEAADGDTATE